MGNWALGYGDGRGKCDGGGGGGGGGLCRIEAARWRMFCLDGKEGGMLVGSCFLRIRE